jgi:hypothetical protein
MGNRSLSIVSHARKYATIDGGVSATGIDESSQFLRAGESPANACFYCAGLCVGQADRLRLTLATCIYPSRAGSTALPNEPGLAVDRVSPLDFKRPFAHAAFAALLITRLVSRPATQMAQAVAVALAPGPRKRILAFLSFPPKSAWLAQTSEAPMTRATSATAIVRLSGVASRASV